MLEKDLNIVFDYLQKLNLKIPKFISCLLTFHFVLLAWIFFRAENLSQALAIIAKIFQADFSILQFSNIYIYMIIFYVLMAIRRYTKIEEFFANKSFINWSMIWLGLIAVVEITGVVDGQRTKFISNVMSL